jgi:hypothetical protein
MLLKIYTIRDSKAEVYTTPFYKKTHGEAERDFRSMSNDDKTTINKYPEDFDLYYLGEYNDNTGFIESLETPQHIVKAVNCLQTSVLPNEAV